MMMRSLVEVQVPVSGTGGNGNPHFALSFQSTETQSPGIQGLETPGTWWVNLPSSVVALQIPLGELTLLPDVPLPHVQGRITQGQLIFSLPPYKLH